MVLPGIASSAVWSSKLIANLQPPSPASDCVVLTLAGVSEADPINSGSPWIAIPRSTTGFDELYAGLLAAKLADKPITLYTNATINSCGYVGIRYYYFP